MDVVAKFKVVTKTETETGFSVVLNPVVSSDENSENGRFYKYTPAGKIELTTINESAANAFVVGSECYVTFERI